MVTHLRVIRMTWCQSFPPKLAKKGHITSPGQPPEPSLQSNPMFVLKPKTPGWINTCEPTVPGTRHWEPVRLAHREYFRATPQPILFGQKNGKTKTEKKKNIFVSKKTNVVNPRVYFRTFDALDRGQVPSRQHTACFRMCVWHKSAFWRWPLQSVQHWFLR